MKNTGTTTPSVEMTLYTVPFINTLSKHVNSGTSLYENALNPVEFS